METKERSLFLKLEKNISYLKKCLNRRDVLNK